MAAWLAPPAGAADAPAASRYVLDPAKSSLEFTFTQAGARNKGRFKSLQVSMDFNPATLEASHLEVTVEIKSVDTGDQERDDTLRSAELFSVSKFPQAHFAAAQINRTAAGYEAVGKLTIRGVTRDARVPFSFRTASENGAQVGYMSGNFLASRMSIRLGVDAMIWWGLVLEGIGATFSLVLAAFAHPLGPFIIFFPQLVTSVGNGMMLPNSIAGAVSIRPQAAGTASGLTGCVQMAVGALFVQLGGHVMVDAHTALPLAFLTAAIVVGYAFSFFVLVRPKALFGRV